MSQKDNEHEDEEEYEDENDEHEQIAVQEPPETNAEESKVGRVSVRFANDETVLDDSTPGDISTVIDELHEQHPTIALPQGGLPECDPNTDIDQAQFALISFSDECKSRCSNDVKTSLNCKVDESNHVPDTAGYGDDSDACCNKEIILGEPEKQYFRNLGQELLQVGRQLLTEFTQGSTTTPCNHGGEIPCCSSSKVEPPPCVISSPKFSIPVSGRSSQQKQEPGTSTAPATATATSTAPTAPATSQDITFDLEQSKRDFIDAFSRICDTIGGGSVNKYRPPCPMHETQANNSQPSAQKKTSSSEEEVVEALSPDANTTSRQDVSRTSQTVETVAEIEKKIEELTSRLSLTEIKLPELDSYTSTIMETVLKHNTALTLNVQNLEKDVLRLAKLIHELQCVTKVQMHFGRIAGLDEGYSDIPEHLDPMKAKASLKHESATIPPPPPPKADPGAIEPSQRKSTDARNSTDARKSADRKSTNFYMDQEDQS